MGLFSSSPPAQAPQAPPTPPASSPESRTTKIQNPPPPLPEHVGPPNGFLSPRKPLVMFLAGGAFLALSTFVTKRAVTRRYTASIPKYYQSNMDPNKFKGLLEAVEALQLATLNVMGGAIMFTGGTLWALQISNIEQLRARLGVHKESAVEEVPIEAKESEKSS